jgi:hypothetical protein
MAANAAHLAQLNPFGIDLNFGCPTPLVNRNRGGAALLDEPELLQRIAGAVRAAVPPAIPVTAKMRLGIEDTGRALDCALALEAGGVQELVVHARTKADGYPSAGALGVDRAHRRGGQAAADRQRRSVDRRRLPSASAPPAAVTTSCWGAARWPTRCWRGASVPMRRSRSRTMADWREIRSHD